MSTHADHEHELEHHITPPSQLTLNLIRLAVLMALTILAAQVDFGHMIARGNSAMGSYINNFVAMAIAIVKAYFVVQIFMGVKWGSKLVKLWAWTGFVWVPLLWLTFGDYTSRTWENNKGWNPGASDMAAFPSQVDEVKKQQQKEFWEHTKATEGEKSGH